jgi:hypothetical protein
MTISINKTGFTELIVSDNCEWDEFYFFAGKLKEQLKISYKEKSTGLDSCYLLFDFEGCNMMVHYNIYMGISIYPEKGELARELDNQKVMTIFNTLSLRI